MTHLQTLTGQKTSLNNGINPSLFIVYTYFYRNLSKKVTVQKLFLDNVLLNHCSTNNIVIKDTLQM